LEEDNKLLSLQLSNLQGRYQEVLDENNHFRKNLLQCETGFKNASSHLNNICHFDNNNNEENNQNLINEYKYGVPYDISKDHINKDISQCIINFDKFIQRVKYAINNGQNTIYSKTRIEELENINREYESLIRIYINKD